MLILISSLLLVSALFSSCEIVMLAMNHYRLHQLENSGAAGRVLRKLMEQPERVLVGIIMGNVMINIILASVVTEWTRRFFGDFRLGLSVVISTVLVVLVGEILPKMLTTRFLMKFAQLLSLPLALYTRLIAPLLSFIVVLTEGLVKISKTSLPSSEVSREELYAMLNQQENQDVLPDSERLLLNRILAFSHTTAEQAMTERQDVVGVQEHASRNAIEQIIHRQPYSKYPVFDDGNERIVGVLDSQQFLLHPHKILEQVMSEVLIVPPNKSLDELYRLMLRRSCALAIVVDEYGMFKGMLTVNNIMDHLIGQAPEQHTVFFKGIRRLDSNRYLVRGSVRIKHLEEYLQYPLGTQEDLNVNGWVQRLWEDIPEQQASKTINALTLTIRRADQKEVHSVLIEINTEHEAGHDA